MMKQSDVKYAEHSSCLLDIYTPDIEYESIFVYFHGGGLEAGDKTEILFMDDLLRKGIAVVSANYRMYPHAQYPDFIVDAADAVAFIQKKFPEKQIYVGGSSAGGYLSMMLCFDKRYLVNAGANPDTIAGYVHDAGQPTTHFAVLSKRGFSSQRLLIDEAAPAYFAGLEKDLPPMLFIVSDNDMNCRLEQTNMLCKTLDFYKIGYDFKLMHGGHCEYVNKQDDAGDFIFAKLISDFIQKH